MFTLDYCGYNISNADCDTIYRPNGSGNYLFLLILSPMNIYFTKDTPTLASKNACLLYTPDMYQHYQAIKEFKNSYFHFYATEEEVAKYPIPLNQLFYPQNTDNINLLIKRLHAEYYSKQLYYAEKTHSLISQLFIDVSRTMQECENFNSTNLTLFLKFNALRLSFLSNCEQDWTVDKMCEQVNLEKSQFYLFYNEFFHNTPKAELINARIDKAKNLLTNNALQIQQVATLSGFQNIYHFTRYFKKACGFTPSEFAKRYRK